MKIPVYDPQINASTVQYNAVADIRTNTLGEIADGLQQYGKFREAQLEEERQTERFKADSAIKYELEDAHSKMLDAIQNGGAYADAEAKYQKTFDETLAKYMPMMGDDPNIQNVHVPNTSVMAWGTQCSCEMLFSNGVRVMPLMLRIYVYSSLTNV